MKITEAKKLALSISLAIAFFFSMVYTGVSVYLGTFDTFTLLGLAVLMFLFSFFLVDNIFSRFIYKKLKIIYRTMHNIRTGKDNDPRDRRTASLDEVNQQVAEWGQEQKAEIDKLKELAVYRREFLGNVSHELKTPIFNIQGYVLTLLDGGLNDPKINRDYLVRSEKSINRMIAIIEDLETISQLESGILKPSPAVFDIVALSREVMEFMEIKADQKNVRLEFDRTYEKPLRVKADPRQIRQVLINLIDNAIKYCKESDCYTRLGFYDMDENILIEVSDNGLGIDKENIPRIFERFYRTDRGRSRQQGGSGLGLAIVKHIVEAHEQAINVRSSLGVGTTFGFTLEKAGKS